MKQFKLNVTSRSETGRGPARRLRKTGRIPANLYGKQGARSISVSADDFRRLNKQAAGSAALIELLDDDGASHLALIQSTQRDPITDHYDHIDFHEVARGEVFTAHIPVRLQGEDECYGVRNESGLVDQHVYDIEVRCKPTDLPEHIDIDVSPLHIGEGVHIRDLKAPSGVEIHGDPDILIVACVGSRITRIAGSASDDAEIAAEEVAAATAEV